MRELTNQSNQDLSRLPSIGRGEAGVHVVPSRVATEQSLQGFGRLVSSFATVDIAPWPAPGRRPIVPGTGVGGGTVAGAFTMERHGSVLYAENEAVERRYITGWFTDPPTASDNDRDVNTHRIFTHEANY